VVEANCRVVRSLTPVSLLLSQAHDLIQHEISGMLAYAAVFRLYKVTLCGSVMDYNGPEVLDGEGERAKEA
jgi:hypothetical protein